jgi:D-arabinose 1-dehydrogenase-like Zn-dependent alcohol dehydrogenase
VDLAEALDFAARGLVHVESTTRRLEEINDVFAELKAGRVNGRVVLDLEPNRVEMAREVPAHAAAPPTY